MAQIHVLVWVGSLMWEEAGAPGEAPRLNVIGYHWPQNCCSRILMKPHYTASTMYPTQTHTHTLTLNHSCTAVTALCLPNIFTANIKKPNMLTKQSSQNTDLMFNTSTDGSEWSRLLSKYTARNKFITALAGLSHQFWNVWDWGH